jgi:uncharacterized alpha-E superfamily protein
MLSRVADSVYWMSRYVERAENVARFIDVNNNLALGAGETIEEQWAPLVYTTGDHGLFLERYGEFTRQQVLHFLMFDRDNPNSLLSCVEKARENARTIREVISSAMWEELNVFFHLVRAAAGRPVPQDEMHLFCNQVKRASHVLLGATRVTMSHGEAWHFARLGRLLERADNTSRIVDVQYYLLLPDPQDVGTSLDIVRWSAMLKSTSALEMYRRGHGRILPAKVADFLILDRLFPRSVHFCLIKAHESLQNVAGSFSGTFRTRAEQQMGRLRSEMDYTRIEEVIERGLHEYIDDLQTQLNAIGEAIYEDFFEVRPFVADLTTDLCDSAPLR